MTDIHDPHATIRSPAWQVIAEVTAAHNVPLSLIRSAICERPVRLARRELAARLRQINLPATTIGRLINRDQSTVWDFIRGSKL